MNTPPFKHAAQKETPHQRGQGDKDKTHPQGSTRLVPLESASGIEFLEISHPEIPAASGRYAYVLKARRINLLKLACTCSASGVCPVCRAWQATKTLNDERKAFYGRP